MIYAFVFFDIGIVVTSINTNETIVLIFTITTYLVLQWSGLICDIPTNERKKVNMNITVLPSSLSKNPTMQFSKHCDPTKRQVE